LAGCCECGDEPPGSGATELVSYGKLSFSNNLQAEPSSSQFYGLISAMMMMIFITRVCMLPDPLLDTLSLQVTAL
jgi:hypothetical protein